jgi:two-component system, LytTR family, response regulator LytT
MANRATVGQPVPMISAVLVDDEKLASEELAYQLKEFPDIEVVATASNGIEAVKLIEDLEPDLVFLDVQMPGLDGMGVIRKLRDKNIPLPYFVMATAYDQYAVEAFRWQALDYLLKPVDKDRLALAVDRARKGIA